MVAGKTFRYAEGGGGHGELIKKVIIASSRGGFYGADTAMAALDHQENTICAASSAFSDC